MSDEGQRGTGPGDAPTPPTTTRRAEGQAADVTGLVPPFMPARDRASASGAGVARESGTVEPVPMIQADEAFPFDRTVDGAEPDQGLTSGEPEAAANDRAGDEFPFDVFDLDTELPDSRMAADRAGEMAHGPSPAVEALADRLESLAARLRAQGTAAVESDMAASDRLTSLLGAVLAGYLASSRH